MQLLHGDCLQLMQDIPDGSVDMVMADPPYGTTACHWDSIIPLEPMWAQLKRVIKRNGAIVMTASQPFTTTLIASNMKMFKYCWVWVKNCQGGFVQGKNKPMPKHEDVLVFSNGVTTHKGQSENRMLYNPQGVVFLDRVSKSPPNSESCILSRPSHKVRFRSELTNLPNTVLQFNVQRDGIHPTQKPVDLMAYLIKTYTNEGDTVLDFCCGSGTTGIACHRLKRKFIGMEKDADYFRIASERIKAEQDQGVLF